MTLNQSDNINNLENSTDEVDAKGKGNEPKPQEESIANDLDSSSQSPGDDETSCSVANTEARLEQLEKEHDTLKNQYVRIAADFDNFRKRQTRDQDDLKIQLICKSLSAILPIVDNFERARQSLKPETEEAQSLHRSYQGLYKQLVEVLKQQGVAPMRVLGQQFDPNLHEAVLREPSDEFKEDFIVEELQRGYHLDGKVLRHALVKVSMGPGPQNKSQDEEGKDTVKEDISSDNNSSEEK
tara:strand:+ start:1310 stop:2029 length:720 start_codon:yes stop_codon:yes gene_type:complete